MATKLNIELSPAKSSFIKSFGYDMETKTLRVEMKNGNVYDHVDVTPERAAAFTGAQSHGKYYNDQIRPHHEARKVEK